MENDMNKSNESRSDANARKSYKDQSPEEVKEKVKETVAKGVAAVAGALKGFSEEAKKDDLAGTTKEVIQKAGETTREIAGTAKSELQSTRSELKGGATSGLKGGSSSGSMGTGSTYSGQSSGQGSMGMGGSSLEDVPDVSKTKIGKSDEELQS